MAPMTSQMPNRPTPKPAEPLRAMTEDELEYWRGGVKRLGGEPTVEEHAEMMASTNKQEGQLTTFGPPKLKRAVSAEVAELRERIAEMERDVQWWRERHRNLESRLFNHLNRIIDIEERVDISPHSRAIQHTCGLCLAGRCDKSYDHT